MKCAFSVGLAFPVGQAPLLVGSAALEASARRIASADLVRRGGGGCGGAGGIFFLFCAVDA